ncbi:TonB-dependent receptor plug domain-containing protein [Campylobacter concisus]|uniref:TonB-dependent receptor n=1 Tax=Campylobacter concisus ATCC 51562 TaxID=1242969 RepID=U2EPG0_9BACT|nr:TonB-dependent receptor [Campylobacter concisus]ERJ25931.1 TonB-dependent receptor [Campylobacter concisus ATCC 51562]
MKKLGLIACCAAMALHGEVFTLGKVEVVGELGGLQKSDANVAVINEEQMQKDNIKRLSQVAYTTPGVYVDKKGPRAEQNFYVRGFDARRTPLFIDGIPVYVPYDGNADFGRFTTFDLSRIDISKGSSSVLYGPNTMGGAINLITKKPSKELEGSLGYGFETGKNAKTYGNNVDFSIGTKQELFYAQAGGSYIEDAGQQLSHKFSQKLTGNEDGGRRDNSVQRDKKFNIKFGFTPNETDEYAVAYVNQKGEKEQPFYTGRYASWQQQVYRYWDWPRWDRESLYFLSHTDFGPLYVNTKIFNDTFENELYSYDNKEKTVWEKDKNGKLSPNHKSRYKDKSYGFGVEVGGDLGDKDTLKFATSYKHDHHKGAKYKEPEEDMKDKMYSFGLENTYKFSDMTKIIAGISYDVRKPISARAWATLPISGTNNTKSEMVSYDASKEHAFNYQAAIKHSFDGNDELSLSYAKKTYFPSMKERYSTRFNRYISNPNLKPEVANHYEIGYQRNFGETFRLETALFYSKIKDAIGDINTGLYAGVGRKKTELRKSVNIGKSEYKGFELGAVYFATKDLELGGNYTYLSAKYKNTDDSLVFDIPKHKAFAYMDYKFLSKFSIYLSQYMMSTRFSNAQETTKLAGFGTTNIKFTYKPTETLSFEAGVSNLFDKNYEYREGFPEEGRIFFTNVRYKF